MAIFTRIIRSSTLVLTGLSVSLVSCNEPEETTSTGGQELSGEQIYMQKCISCHGKNGDLGVSGAADLSKSQKSMDEKVQIIKKGGPNGVMQAYGYKYGGSLNDDQVQKLVEYIEQLNH